MSTPEARRTRSHMSVRGYERNVRRRKTRLDVDLNAPPSEAVEDTLTINLNVLGTISLNVSGNSQHAQNVEQRREIAGTSGGGGGSVAQTPPMIDVEEIDDEVVISSPRRFAEARKKRRNHTEVSRSLPGNSFSGNSVQEATRVSLEDYIMRTRARPSQTIIDCEHYIDLESSNTAKSIPQPPPPPPPPKEPTFSCPVCMGPLVEEASTKCGHIFCKKCIKAAITAQNKCPTCRRKLTLKDIIRVYLPTTN